MDNEEYSRILLLCSIHKDDIVQSWGHNNYPGLTNNKTDVKQIETQETILVSEPNKEKEQQITDTAMLDMLSVV
jgi:hypothetical protein